ncbi:EAL domain-containing protein [Vibrio hannami]|uniref:bifunctional diguanylate cyclase/phosphodiesterase n=1 Tax=Vibrio hannami TaxID=2717094 RepID=UPI00240F808C|nr:EAL domain-containing protein [Vibrio hannami]MDG3086240.1 EAL domain-containing protein [Vibrio hannami]
MKVRTQITLSIIPIILLQMVVLIVPSVWFYQEFISNKVEEYIQDSVSQTRSAFEVKIDSVKADSAMLSENIILNRYLKTEDAGIRAYVMHKTMIKEFASFRRIHPEYVEISLLTPDGYEEVSLHKDDHLNKTDEEQYSEYYKAITSSPNDHEILATKDSDTGEWVLVSVRKLYQQDLTIEKTKDSPGVLKGYLVIKVVLNFIHSFIHDNQLGSSGFTALHDKWGNLIVSEGKYSEPSIIKPSLEYAMSANLEQPVISIRNSDSEYVVGHTHLVSNLYYTIGWPESELNETLISTALRMIVSGILVLTSCGLTLYWHLHKKLIVPILDLQSAARNMGNGNRNWSFRRNAGDELCSLAQSIREMGEGLLRQQQKMRDIAYVDSLTQLPNRLYLTEELERKFSHSGKHEIDIALLFMDLDGFKHVNDTEGHEMGDEVLVTVAKRLRYTLRRADVIGYVENERVDYNVARLGGDEFTVILYGVKERLNVVPVVERILSSFRDPIIIDNKKIQIGASIGIALSNENINSASDIIKCADIAMYDAKMNGKNTYRFFSEDSARKALRVHELRELLQDAINDNKLSIAYQPQYCAQTRKLLSCEALVRWKHPQEGWISPEVFIPIAEENGLITQLGQWVLNEVCLQITRWQMSGFDVPRVSINVSNVQFASVDVHKLVLDYLDTYKLSPKHLTIEVTESSIMQGNETVNQLMKLQQDGLRISLDDFGTGYSSLSALKGLPINELKIDKSFISDIDKEGDGQAIVSAIIAMAQRLGLEVVAEGVETKEEFSFLQQKDADIIQGYYFSKPLMKDAFSNLLLESKTSRTKKYWKIGNGIRQFTRHRSQLT